MLKSGNDQVQLLGYEENVPLDVADTQSFYGSNWITDDALGFIFNAFLAKYAHEELLLVHPHTSSLLTGSHSSLEYVKLFGVNSRSLVLLPINNRQLENVWGGEHWSMLVLDRTEKKSPRFVHLDSSKNGLMNWKVANDAASVLGNSLEGFGPANVISAPVPEQPNSNDSGLFVIALAQNICKWWTAGRSDDVKDWVTYAVDGIGDPKELGPTMRGKCRRFIKSLSRKHQGELKSGSGQLNDQHHEKKQVNVPLGPDDIQSFYGSNWITDHALGFIFNVFSGQYPNEKLLLVHPHFSSLLSRPHSSIEYINSFGVNSRSLVLLPINNRQLEEVYGGEHWSMLVLDRTKKNSPRFVHFDSSENGLMNWQVANDVASILRVRLEGFGPADVVSVPVPEQPNSDDCGLFVIALAENTCRWWTEGRSGGEKDWVAYAVDGIGDPEELGPRMRAKCVQLIKNQDH